MLAGTDRPRRASRVPYDPDDPPEGTQSFQILDFERQASFFMTGGLVAVHAEGRDRDAIWNALAAARGVRHERRPHPAVVRPAERPERRGADGRAR